MSQSTVSLVQNLFLYHSRFLALNGVIQEDVKQADISYACSLSYTTLKFTMSIGTTLYFRCHVKYDDKTLMAPDFYHAALKDTTTLQKQFMRHVMDDTEVSGRGLYPYEINTYLLIAERIALQAHYCGSGDSYHPGCFSEITMTKGGVTLSQINHKNSRSLAHKDNYSLRDLEFFIPLQQGSQKSSYQDEFIGAMRIRFSDRSSENNQECGVRIRKQIDEEKQAFGEA